jgi:hypothetical protein
MKVTDPPTFTDVVVNPGQPERSPFQNALCTYADFGRPPTRLSSSPQLTVSDVSISASRARSGLQLATMSVLANGRSRAPGSRFMRAEVPRRLLKCSVNSSNQPEIRCCPVKDLHDARL